MSQRRYHQFCPLAKALDVIGERWTLLIVRELLSGPKRYTDLRQGLRGLATDLLAARLRDLQQAGVIDRREVPPPTPATVYELTERGFALQPAILELARWGRPLLLDPDQDHLPDGALQLGLEAMFHPEAAIGVEATYDLAVDNQRVTIRIHDGTLDITPGAAARHATAKIITDRQGFIALARGHPTAHIQLEGAPDALTRLQRIFSAT